MRCAFSAHRIFTYLAYCLWSVSLIFRLGQDLCGGFVFVLAGIELVIVAVQLQKFVVVALLHDPAVFHHQDHIRIADGG